MDPPEEIRRAWKLLRDTTRRGYTTDEVLDEMDHRERDSVKWVRPQRAYADLVITFRHGSRPEEKNLDAEILLRPTVPHPDLSGLGGDGPDDLTITTMPHGEQLLNVPGILPPGRAQEIEEAIWDRLHFARHLQLDRLGQFTRGMDLYRSDALAITQLLVLYQLGGQLFPYVPRSADEFAGYCMGASAFLGLADALRSGDHIRVTLVADRLAPRARRAISKSAPASNSLPRSPALRLTMAARVSGA
jgi:hypothetical protein